MSNRGKTVRLFLVDGTPGGLLTAEIMNWTGHVMAAPRSALAVMLKRIEASRTGIYILLGDDPDSLGGVRAYIGEADAISSRLPQHAKQEEKGGKDFWDRVIVLTSKDANLTKAHARYLEARFIGMAVSAKRSDLVNGTAPPLPPLPEADRSDMEFFISQAEIVLPVMGVNILRASRAKAAQETASSISLGASSAYPVFETTLPKESISALAQEIDGEFTVFEGSQARERWTGVAHGYDRLYASLKADGMLAAQASGSPLVFTHNQVFKSPSAAAAVVAGRSANGRRDWKIRGTSTTFGEWQSGGVESAESQGGIP